MKQPQLLPPLAEIHFCFLQKHPLNRSLSRAAVFAKSFQVSLVSRISQQRLHHSHRPRIRRMRQLQGDGVHRLQLIHDHLDNPPLRQSFLVQPFELARMQDQFSQQRRNIHHKTLSAKPAAKFRQKIQRPHRNRPRHRHGVRGIRRNPQRAHWWHHPNALLRAQRHHPARSKQQLVLRMRMLRDHVAMCEVGRHACHLAEKPSIRCMKYALALMRHFLSRYRENLPSASAIPDGRTPLRIDTAGGKSCWHQEKWSASSPPRTTTKPVLFTKAILDLNLSAWINLPWS